MSSLSVPVSPGHQQIRFGRRKPSRILTLGAALAATVALATGCGGGTSAPRQIHSATDWVDIGKGLNCKKITTGETGKALLCDGTSSGDLTEITGPTGQGSFQADDSGWKDMGRGFDCKKFRIEGDSFVACDGYKTDRVVNVPEKDQGQPTGKITKISEWEGQGNGMDCLVFKTDGEKLILCDGTYTSGLTRVGS